MSSSSNIRHVFTPTFVGVNIVGFIYFKCFVFPLGPDMCSKQPLCPPDSLCVSTLGSYVCVCQRGHYDVSAFTDSAAASRPLCKGTLMHNTV